MPTPDDRLGAFCSDRDVFIPGANEGSLAGLTFAAKDVYDIAGFRTGAGNPDWLRTHLPARHTASAVQRVLDSGATLVGKTHTDELTFSLNGENHHYGTPVNPNAPGRVPGGSSSGSASATAGGLVDFALGTDTGGSVRLPAGNCPSTRHFHASPNKVYPVPNLRWRTIGHMPFSLHRNRAFQQRSKSALPTFCTKAMSAAYSSI
jgi:hypothetical protein